MMTQIDFELAALLSSFSSLSFDHPILHTVRDAYSLLKKKKKKSLIFVSGQRAGIASASADVHMNDEDRGYQVRWFIPSVVMYIPLNHRSQTRQTVQVPQSRAHGRRRLRHPVPARSSKTLRAIMALRSTRRKPSGMPSFRNSCLCIALRSSNVRPRTRVVRRVLRGSPRCWRSGCSNPRAGA
jgi:hypothetical protein